MSAWEDDIIRRFPVGVSRMWIALDPDDILLDEQLLAGIGRAGFELIDFDDPIAFRAEYEERYRSAWQSGSEPPAHALILRYKRADVHDLPWDYLEQTRQVRLSLSELFPHLSYKVVKSLDKRYLAQLFDAHQYHAPQPLGDNATKDFILVHIFQLSAFLIVRPEDLWRELLRCHYNDLRPPAQLVDRITDTLVATGQFPGLDIAALWTSKASVIDALQMGWVDYLASLGAELPDGISSSNPMKIPFSHPDVRTFIDSMFLDGELQPVPVKALPDDTPQWVRLGSAVSEASTLDLVNAGLAKLESEIPQETASHRDWAHFANRFAELLKRYHLLDYKMAAALHAPMATLRVRIDQALFSWLATHYSALPSRPIGSGPVVLSHIPRFLDLQRGPEPARTALIVLDGMAIDQWKLIKEHLARTAPRIVCDDMTVFSWLPTLTSICRQSIFSGMKPREFADSINTTGREEALWQRFWLDCGLRKPGIGFIKGLKRVEQLNDISAIVGNPNLSAIGIVVDALDELVHGAVFGKRGIAHQIGQWLETGFVERLLSMLLDANMQVYVTSDHGNTDAIGIGRPNIGETTELRGERVRVYRSDLLRSNAFLEVPTAIQLPLGSLPADYRPMFAPTGAAFVAKDHHVVAHGGASIEECLVPFVGISYK